MVRIGIIGIGFMGYTHFEASRALKNAAVTAICSRDPKKLAGDWNGIQGNFGPPAGSVDTSGLKQYTDYNELINDPDVDLIDICLPTDLHGPVARAAIAAGKPTLVEKPLTVDLKEAQELLSLAEAPGVPLMVAHVLPFFPEFKYAHRAIQSREHGRLLAAHFRRVICPPAWLDDAGFRRLGGWGVDLHIHDNHFIALSCGRPEKIVASGQIKDDLVNHVHTIYDYGANGPTVTCVSGGIAANGLQFAHGYELYFENATIVFSAGTYGTDWVVDRPLSLILNDGTVTQPELAVSDSWCAAFTDELEQAAAVVSSGSPAGALCGQVARDALAMCHAEAESIRLGDAVCPA